MKTKNLVTLAIALVLTVLLTVLCVTGVQVGKNIVIPALEGATKGGDFADASYIVYSMNAPAAETAEEEAADETADEATEEATADGATEEATADEATEEATADGATEEATADEATEEATADEATEEAVEEPAQELDYAALAEDTYEKLLRRAAMQQISGVTVSRLGEDKLRVEIPSAEEAALSTVRSAITIPGQVSFRNADGLEIVSGDHITSAAWGYDSNSSAYTVAFQFDEVGAEQFAVGTQAAIGSTIGITLDDEQMVSISISSAMTQGSAALSFSDAMSAYSVAYALNAGSLGLELEEVSSGSVPAAVSEAQFTRVMIALGIVLLVVLVALVIVHKGLGLAAAISLLLTMVCTVYFFGLVPYVTLTFASILGLIAVAAVKLFCDLDLIGRIEKNIAGGSLPRSAVSAAFGVNIRRTLEFAGVTLLLALLMQYLGSAPVKGFTAPVAIGSALSCLLTMLVTRPLAMCAVDKKSAVGK